MRGLFSPNGWRWSRDGAEPPRPAGADPRAADDGDGADAAGAGAAARGGGAGGAFGGTGASIFGAGGGAGTGVSATGGAATTGGGGGSGARTGGGGATWATGGGGAAGAGGGAATGGAAGRTGAAGAGAAGRTTGADASALVSAGPCGRRLTTSTTTAFERPWLKLCRTVPCSTGRLRLSVLGTLKVLSPVFFVSVIQHPFSDPAGRLVPDERPPALFRVSVRHATGLVDDTPVCILIDPNRPLNGDTCRG